MIKTLLKLPLCCVLGLILSFSQAKEAEFLPEVKALFEIQPLDPARLENNLFIVFNGLTFPHDDYDTVFAKVIRNNYKKIALSIKEGTFDEVKLDNIDNYLDQGGGNLELLFKDNKGGSINPNDYLPCNQYLNRQCIQETISKEALINELRDKNSLILARYTKLLRQVDHLDTISYPDRTFQYDQFISYQNYMKISNLQLAEAILQLNAGSFEEGLSILEYERAMIELYLNPDSNLILIDAMIMVVRIQILDQILNAILEAGFFDSELKNPRIERLFMPYTKIERQIALRAYKREIFNMFSPIYSDQLKIIENNQPKIILDDADKILVLGWMRSFHRRHAPHLEAYFVSLTDKYEHDLEKILGLY